MVTQPGRGGTKLVGVKLAVSFSVVNGAGILLTLERSQQQDYYLLVQVSFRFAQEERQETTVTVCPTGIVKTS